MGNLIDLRNWESLYLRDGNLSMNRKLGKSYLKNLCRGSLWKERGREVGGLKLIRIGRIRLGGYFRRDEIEVRHPSLTEVLLNTNSKQRRNDL